MKEKFYAFLKWTVTFVSTNKALILNVAAIVTAYKLAKTPGWEEEKELLEALCVALGIGGTALVRSVLHKPESGAVSLSPKDGTP